MSGCSNSATEDFEEINGQAKKKTLKLITATSKGAAQESVSANFLYDSESKLINVLGVKGAESISINYGNDGSTIKGIGNGNSESLSIEELYKSPYEIYKTGEVLEYDSNKNPRKILFRQNVYNYVTGDYTIENYTAEMFYDAKPNLYFATLEAAGLIDILDGVELSLGVKAQAS